MTAECYREPNYTTWRAALIEYEHIGVHSSRSIHVEATPLRLLREVAPQVLDLAATLVDFFYEYFSIDDEILRLLFDPNGECPLFHDCHAWREIIPLLRHMAKSHEKCLVHAASDESILGEWYHELQLIGDVWGTYTNPPGNYIYVPLEADVPTFAKRLLEHEAKRFDARLVLVQSDEERFQAVGHSRDARELHDATATDLGQLAVLAYAPNWEWRDQATIRAFWKWVNRFNAANEG